MQNLIAVSYRVGMRSQKLGTVGHAPFRTGRGWPRNTLIPCYHEEFDRCWWSIRAMFCCSPPHAVLLVVQITDSSLVCILQHDAPNAIVLGSNSIPGSLVATDQKSEVPRCSSWMVSRVQCAGAFQRLLDLVIVRYGSVKKDWPFAPPLVNHHRLVGKSSSTLTACLGRYPGQAMCWLLLVSIVRTPSTGVMRVVLTTDAWPTYAQEAWTVN